MGSDLDATFLDYVCLSSRKWGVFLNQPDAVGTKGLETVLMQFLALDTVSINRRAALVAGLSLVPGLVAGFIPVLHCIQAMFLKPMTS